MFPLLWKKPVPILFSLGHITLTTELYASFPFFPAILVVTGADIGILSSA
jgi:hypothetical protein